MLEEWNGIDSKAVEVDMSDAIEDSDVDYDFSIDPILMMKESRKIKLKGRPSGSVNKKKPFRTEQVFEDFMSTA